MFTWIADLPCPNFGCSGGYYISHFWCRCRWCAYYGGVSGCATEKRKGPCWSKWFWTWSFSQMLVEMCRQLPETLVMIWEAHNFSPTMEFRTTNNILQKGSKELILWIWEANELLEELQHVLIHFSISLTWSNVRNGQGDVTKMNDMQWLKFEGVLVTFVSWWYLKQYNFRVIWYLEFNGELILKFLGSCCCWHLDVQIIRGFNLWLRSFPFCYVHRF